MYLNRYNWFLSFMVHYWFNTLYKKNEFNLLFISSLFFHFHLFWFPHINHGYVNKRALPLFFSFCFHIAWGENRLWPLLRMSGSSLPSQKERFYLSPICIHINKEAASPLLLISSASHTAQTHEFFQKLGWGCIFGFKIFKRKFIENLGLGHFWKIK